MTPEGKVKKLVTTYLDQLKDNGFPLYYSMFVPVGYGKRNTLDYTLCLAGHFVAIEAKAPGEDLRPTQRLTCREMLQSGATVFIVSGGEGLDAFKRWVERHADRIIDARRD
jgi:hypothetical protein